MHAHLHTLTRPHTQLLQAGCSAIVSRIVEDLKDEAEPYRRMVMETIDKVVAALGAADIDARLEELLVDGILYAFQEQVREGMRDFTLRGGYATPPQLNSAVGSCSDDAAAVLLCFLHSTQPRRPCLRCFISLCPTT